MRNSENGSEISLGGLEMSTLAKVDAPPMSLGEDSLLNNHEHPPPPSPGTFQSIVKYFRDHPEDWLQDWRRRSITSV